MIIYNETGLLPPLLIRQHLLCLVHGVEVVEVVGELFKTDSSLVIGLVQYGFGQLYLACTVSTHTSAIAIRCCSGFIEVPPAMRR